MPREFDEKTVEQLLKAGKTKEAESSRDESIADASDAAAKNLIRENYNRILKKVAGASVTIDTKTVGAVKGELREQLPAISRAGLWLALTVGVIIGLITFTVTVRWWRSPLWISVPPGLSEMDPAKAKALVENLKSLSDAAADGPIKMFDAIVGRALLPVLTSILGYIFGTRGTDGAFRRHEGGETQNKKPAS